MKFYFASKNFNFYLLKILLQHRIILYLVSPEMFKAEIIKSLRGESTLLKEIPSTMASEA